MRSAKCVPDLRESSISFEKKLKKCGAHAAWLKKSAMLMLRGCWSTWFIKPPAMQVCNGCDKTHWHGCAQESVSDAATLVASGIAAGDRQTHCNSWAKSSS